MNNELPVDFCYLGEIDDTILQDMRYASKYNIICAPLDGYVKPICIVNIDAAKALSAAQKDFMRHGLCLKIYDAYRPQKAIDHFWRWAKDDQDLAGQEKYYPSIKDKKQLFDKGYINKKSVHNSGTAVDLTLMPLPIPESMKVENNLSIDAQKDDEATSIMMGTCLDLMDEKSHAFSKNVSWKQFANRMLLRTIMQKNGFEGIDEEWWHFNLAIPPTPYQAFDFDVK